MNTAGREVRDDAKLGPGKDAPGLIAAARQLLRSDAGVLGLLPARPKDHLFEMSRCSRRPWPI